MPIKAADLAVLVRAIVPVMREMVVAGLAALDDRMRALEDRPAIRGESGPPGPAGPMGPSGRDGRDGQPGVAGLPGEHGLDGHHGKDGRDGIDGLDGRNGLNGLDGLGFDDLGVVEVDGRQVVRFARGELVKTYRLHTLSDRGAYKADAHGAYLKGDGVSYGGAYWIAQQDTSTRPGDPASPGAWRLAVKSGRDGRQGAIGPAGERGPRGPQGEPGGRF